MTSGPGSLVRFTNFDRITFNQGNSAEVAHVHYSWNDVFANRVLFTCASKWLVVNTTRQTLSGPIIFTTSSLEHIVVDAIKPWKIFPFGR